MGYPRSLCRVDSLPPGCPSVFNSAERTSRSPLSLHSHTLTSKRPNGISSVRSFEVSLSQFVRRFSRESVEQPHGPLLERHSAQVFSALDLYQHTEPLLLGVAFFLRGNDTLPNLFVDLPG